MNFCYVSLCCLLWLIVWWFLSIYWKVNCLVIVKGYFLEWIVINRDLLYKWMVVCYFWMRLVICCLFYKLNYCVCLNCVFFDCLVVSRSLVLIFVWYLLYMLICWIKYVKKNFVKIFIIVYFSIWLFCCVWWYVWKILSCLVSILCVCLICNIICVFVVWIIELLIVLSSMIFWEMCVSWNIWLSLVVCK